jgi:DNA-3-methyladenine glycosylase II
VVRRWTANPLILWITRVQIPAPALHITLVRILKVKTVQGKLFPTAPYDFSKSINFMDMFLPSSGEQTTNNSSFTKAVYLQGNTLAFKLENKGSVEKPALLYTFFSENEMNRDLITELIDRINFFMSLNDDLKPFYSLGMKDKAFKAVLNKLYGLHQVKFLTPFEAAAWAVLSQRISMKVAHLMKERLTEAVGDNIIVDGVEYFTFPSATQINNLGVENLTKILNNSRKSEYLMNVSESFEAVDENFLRKGPIGEVKDWLLNIKGIGEWSAHLELIRGLGRMEELSENDRMLKGCAKKIYGLELNEERLKKIEDYYGDFKGYWAYYLRSGC